jgi:hypothetical protein
LDSRNILVSKQSARVTHRIRRRGSSQAGARGEEEQRRPQAVRRRHDVQGSGVADALQLADEQVEYQIRDRLSFMRFLDLGL